MDKKEINDIIKFIESRVEYLDFAYRLYTIYNNNLTKYLKHRIEKELSASSANEALSRLSTINILPKVVNKLSQVYSSTDINYSADIEVIEALKTIKVRDSLERAASILNLHNCVALEPVFTEEHKFVRVLAGHEFLVYSNDIVNPLAMTHFIKILGDNRYAIYTKNEYIEIDAKGNVLLELENEYGVIPFAYATKNTTELMPSCDVDTYEMVTLLPLMLTDANYALKFQAFSIIYGIDVDPSEMKLNPNSVWLMHSEEGKNPSIGSIKPSLAIDDTIKAIQTQYAMWLDTKSLKTTAFSKSANSDLSGIAKMIDDADVSSDVDKQRGILNNLENGLYEIMFKKTALESFEGLEVFYAQTSRLPETTTEKLDRVIKQMNAGLLTKVDAIKQIHGFDTDEQAEDYIRKVSEDAV